MKKIIIFLAPLFIISALFVLDNLNSYADNTNYGTITYIRYSEDVNDSNPSISPTPQYKYEQYKITGNFCFLRISAYDYNVSKWGYTIIPVAAQRNPYLTCQARNQTVDYHNNPTYPDGFYSVTFNYYPSVPNANNPSSSSALTTDLLTPVSFLGDHMVYPLSQSTQISTIFLKQNIIIDGSVPTFSDYNKAIHYLNTGSTDGEIDPDTGDSLLPRVSDTSIPAPIVNWVKDSNGVTRVLNFTNSTYNPTIDSSSDIVTNRYGVEISYFWCSIDDVTVTQVSAQDTSARARVDFTDICYLDTLFDGGYPIARTDSINYVPINGQINLSDSSSFNEFISAYPYSTRNVNFVNCSQGMENKFHNSLVSLNSPYNFLVVECRYYLIKQEPLQQKQILYGEKTVTTSPYPSSGTNFSYDTVSGYIDPSPLPGGDDIGIDTTDFVNTFKSLMTLLGQFPTFITTIFGFLPSWVIALISSAIAILVIVGTIRIITG